jgi:chemotaxis methyl-accepting protein methylase
MTAPTEDSDMRLVMQRVARARGFCCDAYKASCLRRRIAVRMRARGAPTYAAYADILDRDAEEYDRLLDALTVNVSKFYRNAETWDALIRDVLPDIVRRRGASLRCWSAGCASGEESYTLAMVLHHHVPRLTTDHPTLIRVDATDVDERCLAAARQATYRDQAFEEMPTELWSRYPSVVGDPPRRQVHDAVRQLVRLSRHNMVQESPPRPPYDLILCRNVVIYFDRPTQEQLFNRAADALRPGGYLILGKVETLFGEARERLQLINIRERIYQRP